MNYCDEIWWIVDVFGLTDILERYFMIPGYTVTVGQRNGPPGLIFNKGHWKYKPKRGTLYDSYDMKHQIKGTAHFCQSFALLEYLKDIDPRRFRKFSSELQPGQYAHNIQVITKMWNFIFKNNPSLLRIYVNEVKILHTARDESNQLIYPEPFYSQAVNIPLTQMTNKKFLEMLKFVHTNAQKLTGCKEG
jgi:hypothetical protein